MSADIFFRRALRIGTLKISQARITRPWAAAHGPRAQPQYHRIVSQVYPYLTEWNVHVALVLYRASGAALLMKLVTSIQTRGSPSPRRALAPGGARSWRLRSYVDRRNTDDMASKTVETYRTTKGLRALVRRAAKLEQKRPSEFLRQAAEEKAKQVIREHERARLKRLLAEMPPGNLSDEEAERLADEVRHEVGEPG